MNRTLNLLLTLRCSRSRALRAPATIEMTVNGLVCGFCAQGIEKTLRKNAATDDVFVSLENRLVAIATKAGCRHRGRGAAQGAARTPATT